MIAYFDDSHYWPHYWLLTLMIFMTLLVVISCQFTFISYISFFLSASFTPGRQPPLSLFIALLNIFDIDYFHFHFHYWYYLILTLLVIDATLIFINISSLITDIDYHSCARPLPHSEHTQSWVRIAGHTATQPARLQPDITLANSQL